MLLLSELEVLRFVVHQSLEKVGIDGGVSVAGILQSLVQEYLLACRITDDPDISMIVRLARHGPHESFTDDSPLYFLLLGNLLSLLSLTFALERASTIRTFHLVR